MRSRAFLLLLLAGCAATPAGSGGGPAPAEAPRTVLAPDAALSFATITEQGVLLCILTRDWGLRAFLRREGGGFQTGNPLAPDRARFFRGGKVEAVLQPPAGPPPMPLAPGDTPAEFEVRGLAVTLVEVRDAREPDGFIVAAFSEFDAGEEGFSPAGPVRLPLRGPYP